MDIRKLDDKGRITLGKGGGRGLYAVTRHEDGSVTLQPVPEVPSAPQMDRGQMRAVYVDYGQIATAPPTITIFSQLPRPVEFIARLAEECMVPIVVNGSGFGQVMADKLSQATDQPIIVRS